MKNSVEVRQQTEVIINEGSAFAYYYNKFQVPIKFTTFLIFFVAIIMLNSYASGSHENAMKGAVGGLAEDREAAALGVVANTGAIKEISTVVRGHTHTLLEMDTRVDQLEQACIV